MSHANKEIKINVLVKQHHLRNIVELTECGVDFK